MRGVLLRREAGPVRVTVFGGGHEGDWSADERTVEDERLRQWLPRCEAKSARALSR